MLPRVAVLGAAATGVVLLLAVRGAAAQDAPPANPLDTITDAVGSLLTPPPADPVPTPPLTLPDLSTAPDVLGPPVQAVTDTATPVLGAAQAGIDTLITPRSTPTAADRTTPATTLPTLPALPALALDRLVPSTLPASARPDLGTLTESLTPPQVLALAAGQLPGVPSVPLTVPTFDDLDLPALVPAIAAPAPRGTLPPPFPLPQPLPTEPATAFLRPATAPPSTTIHGAPRATGSGDVVVDPPDHALELVLAAIQHAFDDPGGNSHPARGPPDELPRDPSHRGSSDQVSQAMDLPGTDRVGVTRGESWHPGTDVELTNTPPEPSVSPD